MIEMTQMTEPAVIPAEPKTKPVPKRKPKEQPRRDDPWTVPGPKVNPTPKANIIVMKKNKKMKVKTVGELKMLTEMITAEAFSEKFTVSIELVTKMIAKDAVNSLKNTDMSPFFCEQGGRRSAHMN